MAPGNRNNPERCESSESRYSIMEFLADFPDDAACLEWLWRVRYSADGVHAVCAHCEVERPFKRYSTSQQRQSWTCTACGLHVHPTAGTIFHKSSTSLRLWFHAMYLMTSTRCGISAKQLERELGVTYKTAWRMFHLIRNELMDQDDDPMSGEVEMDEMYVGGKPRAKDRYAIASAPNVPQAARLWSHKKKTPVFGMAQRGRNGEGGKVAAYVVPSTQMPTLGRRIQQRVLPKSVVFTDEAPVYKHLKDEYTHHRIHHAQKVYVRGNVHTNTIEGFWALVKTGISGTHHAVSAKFLQGYLNEYAWRYNNRDNPRAMFWLLALRSALADVG